MQDQDIFFKKDILRESQNEIQTTQELRVTLHTYMHADAASGLSLLLMLVIINGTKIILSTSGIGKATTLTEWCQQFPFNA